jgi:porphobilinogen synthase
MRSLIRETHLSPAQLIYPIFVMPGKNKREEISSMPGVFRVSVDQLAKEGRECLKLGVSSVILFGLPEKKDPMGSGAHIKDGIIQRAIKELKNKVPELIVITDVCLCEYTSHGHCGIIIENQIDNDATLEVLAKTAVSHALAGADMVAPSDMMDGRVGEIRAALDEENLYNIPIMSYAVKYASSFYGPFRDAADCAPQEGDRRGYQMDPANSREALREATLDVDEGADILQRRVCHDQSCRCQRLDRRRKSYDRDAAQYKTCRCRHHPDLFCQGHGPPASGLAHTYHMYK